MFAVDILDPQPGENIIDVCSAPGGKTVFIAERIDNKGKVTAVELYEHRLGTITDYCKRNQVTIVEAKAVMPETWLVNMEKFLTGLLQMFPVQV
jgi:16S rRNA (cytosine967-C5)-methyltransferase